MASSDSFDVFLIHNDDDKPGVRELAEALKMRGLSVWLDEEQIPPGVSIVDALEDIISTTRSAAVLIGESGLGPWGSREINACLHRLIKEQLPIIPVLLPNACAQPELPIFLGELRWVDLRDGLTDSGLKILQWGIEGRVEKRAHVENLIKLPRPTTDKLISREKFTKQLNEHLENDSRVVGIIADGGVGKTALVLDWIEKLDNQKYNVVAWTFSDGAESNTPNDFFSEVFAHFKLKPEKHVLSQESTRANFLLENLPDETILVLDGLESLQYHGNKRDGQLPSGEAMQSLLSKALTHSRLPLVVITSRLPLVDLDKKVGYQEISLERMRKPEGAELLRHLGVKGDTKELEQASFETSGHCLSLVLLGKLIVNQHTDHDIHHRYEIYALADSRDDVLDDVIKPELSQAHRIMAYYDKFKLTNEQIILLQMMGLLHSAMTDRQRDALVKKAKFANDMRKLKHTQWNVISTQLEKYGLLAPMRSTRRNKRDEWDCHPLIREHFRAMLKKNGEQWRDAQSVLVGFFGNTEDGLKPEIPLDFIRFYRALNHAAHAEEFRAFVNIYKEYVVQDDALGISSNAVGLAADDVAALKSLFEQPNLTCPSNPDNVLSQDDYLYLWGRMAFCQGCLGHLDAAVFYREKMRDFLLDHNDYMRMAHVNEQLSAVHAMKGDLGKAKKAAIDACDYAFMTDAWGEQERALCRLASVLYLQNKLKECGKKFKNAIDIRNKCQGNIPWLHSDYGIYYRLYKLDIASTANDYQSIIDDAQGAYSEDQNWDVPAGFDLLIQAIALSKKKNISRVKINKIFDEAKYKFEASGSAPYKSFYYLARAEFDLLQERTLRSKKPDESVKEARDIADIYGMELAKIDCDLVQARIHILRGEKDPAKNLLSSAKQHMANLPNAYALRNTDIILLEGELALLENNRQEVIKMFNMAKQMIEGSGRCSLMPRLKKLGRMPRSTQCG
jgi:hypothetical protein